MAKLSARGRTELARVRKGNVKAVLMSDRMILRNTNGYGWKVYGKLRKDLTPEQWLANRLAQGWEQIAR